MYFDALNSALKAQSQNYKELMEYRVKKKNIGERHLAGYSPWGHKKSATTEQLSAHTGDYNYVSNKFNLIDIHTILQSTLSEYVFFLSNHGTFTICW